MTIQYLKKLRFDPPEYFHFLDHLINLLMSSVILELLFLTIAVNFSKKFSVSANFNILLVTPFRNH